MLGQLGAGGPSLGSSSLQALAPCRRQSAEAPGGDARCLGHGATARMAGVHPRDRRCGSRRCFRARRWARASRSQAPITVPMLTPSNTHSGPKSWDHAAMVAREETPRGRHMGDASGGHPSQTGPILASDLGRPVDLPYLARQRADLETRPGARKRPRPCLVHNSRRQRRENKNAPTSSAPA